ncbi:MAG: hypothetical protein ACK55I_06035, partial [bacterium]
MSPRPDRQGAGRLCRQLTNGAMHRAMASCLKEAPTGNMTARLPTTPIRRGTSCGIVPRARCSGGRYGV